MNEPLRLHKIVLQKILTGAIFLLAPAANMLRTSRFPIGCMKRQHAVILESIREINSIFISLPALRTGLFTRLLIFSPLLFFSLLLGQIILSATRFLAITLLDKNILSPIHLPSSLRTNVIQVKFPSFLCSCSLKFLGPTPFFYKKILSPIFLQIQQKSLFLFIYSTLLPLESKQCPLTPASGIGLCVFRGLT